jgi:hypothetical protein
MKWTETDDVPKLGEWLRRRDDGRFARVDHIMVAGKTPEFMSPGPLYDGDVVLNYRPGVDVVTSGGAFFWTKWERFDVKKAAKKAIEVAHGH